MISYRSFWRRDPLNLSRGSNSLLLSLRSQQNLLNHVRSAKCGCNAEEMNKIFVSVIVSNLILSHCRRQEEKGCKHSRRARNVLSPLGVLRSEQDIKLAWQLGPLAPLTLRENEQVSFMLARSLLLIHL